METIWQTDRCVSIRSSAKLRLQISQRTSPSGTGESSSKLPWFEELAVLSEGGWGPRVFWAEAIDDVRDWSFEVTTFGLIVDRAEFVEDVMLFPLLADRVGLAFRLNIIWCVKKIG